MDFHNIEEMSIDHWTKDVTEDQIKDILNYNENDVRATYEFYLLTIGDTDHILYKGINRLELRKNIKKEFNIPCINYNDVKIGDELNKLGYLKGSGKTKQDLKIKPDKFDSFTFNDCIPNYVKFKTDKFNNFFNSIKNIKVNLKEKQEFNLELNGTTYTIMKGGIHSQDKPRKVIVNENEFLRDADIGSQYPNAIRKRRLKPRHLEDAYFDTYVQNITIRLEAKAMYKKTKDPKYQAIQEAYKLALNGGGFGKMGEESSWQYDPFISMAVTIGNQFEILMLIEDMELNGIHVISANTDGIICLFQKELNDKYYQICKEWELLVGNEDLGQLEYTEYSSLIQTSVNDYIAVKTNGEIKTKGDFVSDFEIHKNKSAKIVPLALQAYYSKGIKIEDTIYNHQNIFHN